MKRLSVFLFVLMLSLPVFLQAGKNLTLEDIFKSTRFHAETLNSPTWLPDGSGYIYLKLDRESGVRSFYRHDVQTGKESMWLDGATLHHPDKTDTLRFYTYTLSASGQKILFQTDPKRVWRRFNDGHFYVYDLSAKTMTAVHDGPEHIRHVKFSPNEKMVGYVLAGNIYVKDLRNNQTIAVTTDGKGPIINGMSDWVYEEEFGKGDRWSWSEDGRYIAFHQFDQSPIKTFSWIEYDRLDVKVRTVPYPKAGDPNSIVKIGVYDFQTGAVRWMDIGNDRDIYIPRIRWTKTANRLLIERMNRLQNKLDLLLADANTGSSKVLFTETDSAWVSLTDNMYFMNDQKRFLRTSESSGYNHIYIYDMEEQTKAAVTGGNWEVTDLYGVDETTGVIYFQANKGKIEERQLFRVNLDGTDFKKISSGAGTHYARFAPHFGHYLGYFSNVKTPTQVRLHDSDGVEKELLIANEMKPLMEMGLAYPEFLTFTTSDSVEIHAMITKPADFDPNKKYPVLIYGYSGPASQLVRNAWGRPTSKLWYTLLTQKDYIIFTLDQRGTGGRGKAFKNLAYGDIGHFMHIDHIEGVKYLRSLPYVDADRIGIWGWSGGGYLTLMEMTRGAEYYKMGIAVAPVSDFRLYDNIWTERYMGLPAQNTKGYKAANVMTYADGYKGGLLVVHGTSDDNVHMQNTMQFIEKLQVDGKDFDLMIYPGKNHSMRGKNDVSYHLYKLLTNFILENL